MPPAPNPAPSLRDRVRSMIPSDVAIQREMDRYGIDRNAAIEAVYQRREREWARLDRGEHYGAAGYGRRADSFSRNPLTPAQLALSDPRFGEALVRLSEQEAA